MSIVAAVVSLTGGCLAHVAIFQEPPQSVLSQIPSGAKPVMSICQDLDGDGKSEWVVASEIVDAVDMWTVMGESHTILQVLTSRGGTWKSLGCKEAGQRFADLKIANLFGDGALQVAITTVFLGADNSTKHMKIFHIGDDKVKFVHEFSGMAFEDEGGGVQVGNFDAGDRQEVKCWTEFQRPGQAHAEVHEQIIGYWKWTGKAFSVFRQHIFDRDNGRFSPATRAQVLDNLAWQYDAPDIQFAPFTGQPTCLSSGLPNSAFPAWSPDGKRIAFTAQQEMESGKDLGAWNTNLWVVNADGSDRRKLTQSRDSIVDQPQWSPDGKRIAFRRIADEDHLREESGLFVVDLTGGKETKVSDDNEIGYWLKTGNALYQMGVGIMPLDGSPPKKARQEPPLYNPDKENRNGLHAYWWDRSIRFERGKKKYELVFKPGMNGDPCLSPDGKRLAFISFKNGRWGIWVTPAP